ncbi:MAG: hypothetical protein HY783_05695 [Chloroflexi bacterium]|nr:hypothetical protein [Chloroflexota bacterium]
MGYLKRLLANAWDQKVVGPRRTALVYRFLHDRDIADEEACPRVHGGLDPAHARRAVGAIQLPGAKHFP